MQTGLLYLRYCADPKTLWGWVQRYIDDPEVRCRAGRECLRRDLVGRGGDPEVGD